MTYNGEREMFQKSQYSELSLYTILFSNNTIPSLSPFIGKSGTSKFIKLSLNLEKLP